MVGAASHRGRSVAVLIQDLYGDAAEGWASGAELVYSPLAAALVESSPEDLAGALVLDVGAGTGAGSRALLDVGADPIAVDLVHAMLAHDRERRPPGAVADVYALPLLADAFDAAIAPFVINHLDRPADGLRELGRVVRPSGAILASTFAEDERFPAKAVIDDVAARHGWAATPAYQWLKKHATPLTGRADDVAALAEEAGLADVRAVDTAVELGLYSPETLVRYRFGQAHLSGWLASLSDFNRAAVHDEAVAAVVAMDDLSTLTVTVVHLAARAAETS